MASIRLISSITGFDPEKLERISIDCVNSNWTVSALDASISFPPGKTLANTKTPD
jgi:hypothetical protein